ncbi:beta-galactosidase [Pseudoruegeria sp. SHC-113]|uniref:beta-galactosidase n=1 Tax=Pseudoruegeria sp. SHC-113 TaxID=2855439 RepID=UPI0021BAB885|nr:beta-galactosidase [Pseudoruegeria sp. SHC-113]MCT8162144.1 beta-galactosidase [Pseudoruegeria sp. SHC-113]
MPASARPAQTLGVCYYPEHWPEERWPLDARMMAEAGIEYVRIGEFAWGLMEPDPGTYDWAWLDRAIEVLHKAGRKIVLGTPTATPPKWLVDSMPDMLPIGPDGRVRGFGSRRHYCFSHQGYRAECLRITEAMAQRYGTHPAVAAWQTDNEYGCHKTTLSYSQAALHGFRDWLAQKYQSPEALNRAWGNVFWSMEYRSFDEVELPIGAVTETNPAHKLDFRRYASDQVVAFNRLQCDAIRRHSPGRPISHNFMGKFFEFDHYDVSADLDIAAWDAYPTGFLDRELGDPELIKRYMQIGHPDFDAFHHDLYRACGDLRNGTAAGRWWVMEQQPPGPLNWGSYNPAPHPEAGRLWVWEAFAAGAEVVSFFRWRQPSFAQEQMHEGLLLPDGTPNKGYALCGQIHEELTALAPLSDPARAEVALVFDYPSQWITEIQPHAQDASHFDTALRAYAALRRAGISVDIVPPTAEAIAGRKLVVLPMVTLIEPAFAEALAACEATVLAGPWAGSKGHNLTISEGLPPGPLRALIDIRIPRVETRRPFAPIPLAKGGAFAGWREFVEPGAGVTVVEETVDGTPALLQQGRAFYLPGRPDEPAFDRLMRHVLDAAGVAWLDLPPDVRLRDNGPHRFLFNYSGDPVDLTALFGAEDFAFGSPELGRCGVACITRKT